ncbi:hypothetical protein PAAM106076_03780 [Paracoccus aminovorans]
MALRTADTSHNHSTKYMRHSTPESILEPLMEAMTQ